MRIFILVIFICFNSFSIRAQFTESFSDSNFANNPTWVGDTSKWSINTSGELQSNNILANNIFYISTPNFLATVAQWDFYCRLNFNTSSANYVDVFLTASDSSLSSLTTTGYFIRIGNTDDEVCLYRKEGSSSVKLIDGSNGLLNSTNNIMKIRVTRDSTNRWTLLFNSNGSYVSEGSIIDSIFSTSAYFGILIKQSTSSFFNKHYFDDIEIKRFVPDTIPPILVKLTTIGDSSIDLLFDEPLSDSLCSIISNYDVDVSVGFPLRAVRDSIQTSLVHLFFSTDLPNRIPLHLTLKNIADVFGNRMTQISKEFCIYKPMPFDIVIDEIMADPSPMIALPDAEWLELKNISPFPIDLQGWRIGKSSGLSGPLSSYILMPDSFIVITATGSIPLLAPYCKTIAPTSFPSLINEDDLIFLSAPDGKMIHAVHYLSSWHSNQVKINGGWSLEMIDTHNPCSGFSNWSSSTNILGATPGFCNSLNNTNADIENPHIIRAFAIDSLTIELVFSEPVDSLTAANVLNYEIDHGIHHPNVVTPIGPLFESVLIKTTALANNCIYSIIVSNVTDCSDNIISDINKVNFGLTTYPDSNDIIINEILFNPKTGGSDYLEFYNRSNKIINLKDLYVANKSNIGTLNDIIHITEDNISFFPGDFFVITEDKLSINRDYMVAVPGSIIEVATLPSYPDDAGAVVILNSLGLKIDEVSYNQDWQFALITDPEGVALERISYNAPSNLASNWHSAASDVGYGTPTFKNSQMKSSDLFLGEVSLDLNLFSPDNDGYEDFTTLLYHFPEQGNVMNIIIYDAEGRVVRYLQQSALAGISGNFRWDGLDEKGRRLPSGIYIVLTEVFNISGKKKVFKNVTALAYKY